MNLSLFRYIDAILKWVAYHKQVVNCNNTFFCTRLSNRAYEDNYARQKRETVTQALRVLQNYVGLIPHDLQGEFKGQFLERYNYYVEVSKDKDANLTSPEVLSQLNDFAEKYALRVVFKKEDEYEKQVHDHSDGTVLVEDPQIV